MYKRNHTYVLAVARFDIFNESIEACASEIAFSIDALLYTATIVLKAFIQIAARFAIIESFKAGIAFARIEFNIANVRTPSIGTCWANIFATTRSTINIELSIVLAWALHLSINYIASIRATSVVGGTIIFGHTGMLIAGQRHICGALAEIWTLRISTFMWTSMWTNGTLIAVNTPIEFKKIGKRKRNWNQSAVNVIAKFYSPLIMLSITTWAFASETIVGIDTFAR